MLAQPIPSGVIILRKTGRPGLSTNAATWLQVAPREPAAGGGRSVWRRSGTAERCPDAYYASNGHRC